MAVRAEGRARPRGFDGRRAGSDRPQRYIALMRPQVLGSTVLKQSPQPASSATTCEARLARPRAKT
jgi:hypothetical protein